MHILIALLTAFAGLIWALWRLQQSGVDLNSFNPFFWLRRHAWAKKVGAKPRHQLTRPMDAAAAILLGALRTEGEISREQKQYLIALFEEKFHLNTNQARELFSATAFMLQDVVDMAAEVRPVLAPSLEKFSPEQKQSVLDMLANVCLLDGEVSGEQQAIIAATQKQFSAAIDTSNEWA